MVTGKTTTTCWPLSGLRYSDYCAMSSTAGTSGGVSRLFPPQPEVALPEDDDIKRSVGLRMAYPLFSGGSRLCAAQERGEDLSSRRLERKAATERVEQQIRSALHFACASYASISFTRSAADAERQDVGKLETHN